MRVCVCAGARACVCVFVRACVCVCMCVCVCERERERERVGGREGAGGRETAEQNRSASPNKAQIFRPFFIIFRPDTLSRADQTETPESNTMGSQVEFPIVEQPCNCRTGSDEKVNEAGSEEEDTNSSDSTQSDNRRENAERPYSPPFQR